jgi:hypothetical protein
MKNLLFGIAALLLATGTAHAQSPAAFWGPGAAPAQVYPPSGPWRPINVSPTTGRTYSKEADYKLQRRNKRK